VNVSRVFIGQLEPPEELRQNISEALNWVGVDKIIRSGARVFIKPNLTWKRPTPGVTVTPAFLRALVETLLPLTPNIIIGESEGGQACFQAEDAFASHGLYDLEREYGIKIINLSREKHEIAQTPVNGKMVSVQVPSFLLHEVDVFITVPVPKVHAMTGVSIGFKNQWGCLGDKMRVNQHPYFDATVLALNKLFKPKLCICDGTFFLDGTGPLIGEAVPKNLIIVGDDVGATSMAVCEIMQIDPFSIAHHRLAFKEGMFPESFQGITLNRPPRDFATRRFHLHRSPLSYIHLATFKNVTLNKIFYDSVFADALHEFLWFIRKNPLIKRFLYGKFGPGEANRGGRIC
jgi:uncharacterized protein (DUF362 family)